MLNSHLATLEKKHHGLQARIDHEQRRPVIDTGRIRQFKLEKLQLKDRIERLRRDTAH